VIYKLRLPGLEDQPSFALEPARQFNAALDRLVLIALDNVNGATGQTASTQGHLSVLNKKRYIGPRHAGSKPRRLGSLGARGPLLMVRRPRQAPLRSRLTEEHILRASYRGSDEHKTTRWWGGLPGAWTDPRGRASRPKRQLTTICPLTTATERDLATSWVRGALGRAQIKWLEGDKDFPHFIWYQEEDTDRFWIGRCVNGILGEYKGWPISRRERDEIFG